MNNGERMQRILNKLPYADQIVDINLSNDKCIEFTWRSIRFRVARDCYVEENKDGFMHGSNESILLQALLK